MGGYIHIIYVRQRCGWVTFKLAGYLESVAGTGREFLKIIRELTVCISMDAGSAPMCG